jgi:hypothetical protein
MVGHKEAARHMKATRAYEAGNPPGREHKEALRLCQGRPHRLGMKGFKEVHVDSATWYKAAHHVKWHRRCRIATRIRDCVRSGRKHSKADIELLKPGSVRYLLCWLVPVAP